MLTTFTCLNTIGEESDLFFDLYSTKHGKDRLILYKTLYKIFNFNSYGG